MENEIVPITVSQKIRTELNNSYRLTGILKKIKTQYMSSIFATSNGHNAQKHKFEQRQKCQIDTALI